MAACMACPPAGRVAPPHPLSPGRAARCAQLAASGDELRALVESRAKEAAASAAAGGADQLEALKRELQGALQEGLGQVGARGAARRGGVRCHVGSPVDEGMVGVWAAWAPREAPRAPQERASVQALTSEVAKAWEDRLAAAVEEAGQRLAAAEQKLGRELQELSGMVQGKGAPATAPVAALPAPLLAARVCCRNGSVRSPCSLRAPGAGSTMGTLVEKVAALEAATGTELNVRFDMVRRELEGRMASAAEQQQVRNRPPWKIQLLLLRRQASGAQLCGPCSQGTTVAGAAELAALRSELQASTAQMVEELRRAQEGATQQLQVGLEAGRSCPSRGQLHKQRQGAAEASLCRGRAVMQLLPLTASSTFPPAGRGGCQGAGPAGQGLRALLAGAPPPDAPACLLAGVPWWSWRLPPCAAKAG
jgi:hypothetical protein